MAYDRARTLDMLLYRYGSWLDLAGIVQLDTPDGLAPVLDEVDLVVTDQRNKGVPDAVWSLYARYLMLDVLCGRLGSLFTLSAGGDTYQLSNAYTQVTKERGALAGRLNAAAPGLLVAGVVTTAANEIVTVVAPYLNDPWAIGNEYGMVR